MHLLNIRFFILSLLIMSCAHHPDVRPMSSGVHSVTINATDQIEAQREAIAQAKSYCKSIKKNMYIRNEKSDYVGNVEESAYKAGRTLGRVAGILTGGRAESREITQTTLGNGYKTQIRFECR